MLTVEYLLEKSTPGENICMEWLVNLCNLLVAVGNIHDSVMYVTGCC